MSKGMKAGNDTITRNRRNLLEPQKGCFDIWQEMRIILDYIKGFRL